MSLILALDTSTLSAALALCDNRTGDAWTACDIGTLNHGRELIPAIDRLDAIAVGIGPGSYTGLRVGIAMAKTIAEVLAIPVHPVDSLLLPVIALPPEPGDVRASIADAQRGAVALSIYRFESSQARWTRHHGPEIVAWDELPRRWRSLHVQSVTGPGLALSSRFGPIGIEEAPPESRDPNAAALVAWIRTHFSGSSAVAIDTLEPDYLRPSAAEEKRQAADQSHARAKET